MKTPQLGFTLIEVMTALTVCGVVMATAVPGYSQHLQKGRRADAMTALLQAQLAQEDWRGEHPQYADDIARLAAPAVSSGGHYRLRVAEADASGYTVLATAQSASQQADTGCAVLRLTVRGATVHHGVGTDLRADPAADPQRCWLR